MSGSASTVYWIADYLLNKPQFVWLMWLVIQECHRGLSCLHSCSLCTPQIVRLTLNIATRRSSLMALQWWTILDEMIRRQTTGSWWIESSAPQCEQDQGQERTATKSINVTSDLVGIVEHYCWSTWVSTWTTDWTGGPTLMLCPRCSFPLTYCMQQDARAHLAVCDEGHLQRCGLQGEKHQCQTCLQDQLTYS